MLVSARISFGGRGAPADVLIAWFEGRFQMIVPEESPGELARVLSRPKFRRHTAPKEAAGYVALLRHMATLKPEPAEYLSRPLTPGPKAGYPAALARASRADFLADGGIHLIGLPDPQPPVLTPRNFPDVLKKQD